jgi:hypothetical protein
MAERPKQKQMESNEPDSKEVFQTLAKFFKSIGLSLNQEEFT